MRRTKTLAHKKEMIARSIRREERSARTRKAGLNQVQLHARRVKG
jgi:hypothetical protein